MKWVLLKVLHKFEGPVFLPVLTKYRGTVGFWSMLKYDLFVGKYSRDLKSKAWPFEIWNVLISNGWGYGYGRTICNPIFKKSRFPMFPYFKWSDFRSPLYFNFQICFSGTIEHAVVIELQHDSTYVIRLRACHRPNQNGLTRCSENAVKEVNQHLPSVVEE